MNRFPRIYFIIIVLMIILSGCTTSSLAPTPISPTATAIPLTPTVYHPQHTQLATEKLKKTSLPVQFTLPGMDQVTVANVPYKEGLITDIYYPPGFDFSSLAPAVVFVNAIGAFGNTRLKDLGPYVSWGQLAAASDLIGINYDINDAGDRVADLRDLIAFIETNAEMLGVEKDHICFWSSSSNVQVALDLIADKEGTYQDSLSCAVIYYGFDETQEVNFPPSNIPLLVVKAGQDMPSVNTGIDNLVGKVKAAGHPVELIEYLEGEHGFDFKQDTEETRDIVSRTLEFMKENLTSP